MIVGLGHQAQVGKDTAAELLVEHHGFQRLAFADALKDMAYDINPIVAPLGIQDLQFAVDNYGWEEAKQNERVRKFLQNLGLAAREHINSDVWVRIVMDQAARIHTQGGRAVITDVRFPNEFQALETAGATLVKIVRPGVESNAGSHVSETALADAPWHYTVVNDGAKVDLLNDLEVYLGLGHPEMAS